jgi:hypothetical protein
MLAYTSCPVRFVPIPPGARILGVSASAPRPDACSGRCRVWVENVWSNGNRKYASVRPITAFHAEAYTVRTDQLHSISAQVAMELHS